MASRRMFQFRYSLQRDIVDLTMKASIAAAGAPTLLNGPAPTVSQSKGIASIVRNSAGRYTITLEDNYQALMAANVTVLSASLTNSSVQVVSEDVTSLSAPTVVIQVKDDAGLAADPASGSQLIVHLMLRNAST